MAWCTPSEINKASAHKQDQTSLHLVSYRPHRIIGAMIIFIIQDISLRLHLIIIVNVKP